MRRASRLLSVPLLGVAALVLAACAQQGDSLPVQNLSYTGESRDGPYTDGGPRIGTGQSSSLPVQLAADLQQKTKDDDKEKKEEEDDKKGPPRQIKPTITLRSLIPTATPTPTRRVPTATPTEAKQESRDIERKDATPTPRRAPTPTEARVITNRLPGVEATSTPTPSRAIKDEEKDALKDSRRNPRIDQEIKRIVEQVSGKDIAEAIKDSSDDQAAAIVEAAGRKRAGEILNDLPSDKAARTVINLSKEKATEAVEEMDNDKAARVVENLPREKALEVIQNLIIEKSASTAPGLSKGKAAEVLERVADRLAASIIQDLPDEEATDVIEELSRKKAGAVLKDLNKEKLSEVVRELPQEQLREKLPELTTKKLAEVPWSLLLEKLPDVPADRMSNERSPKAPEEIGAPLASRKSDKLTEFEVPKTREKSWAPIAGGAGTLTEILGKFNTNNEKIKVTLELLEQNPNPEISLGDGRVPQSFFHIEILDIDKANVLGGHVTFSVEKSWLDENELHKWSIELQRFNSATNEWVKFMAKLVSEDETHLYYSAWLPGFSIFAITASKTIPEQGYTISDLTLSSRTATEGQPVTVQAMVKNLANQTTEYPLHLAVDDTTEATKLVRLGPGESTAVSFMLDLPAGSYTVRLDRLTQSLEFTKPAEPAAVLNIPMNNNVAVTGEGAGSGILIPVMASILFAVALASGAAAVVFMRKKQPAQRQAVSVSATDWE